MISEKAIKEKIKALFQSTVLTNDLDKTDYQNAREIIHIDQASFSAILPYRYYDAETGLFINANSLGIGFEMGTRCGADEKLIQSLSDFLRFKLADHYDLHFIFWVGFFRCA